LAKAACMHNILLVTFLPQLEEKQLAIKAKKQDVKPSQRL
jgi:hypothetical protein